ncbi:MAG: hypothetical protein Q8Q32_01110 [bacterium]|nr:hypothetical protein [bacterium]
MKRLLTLTIVSVMVLGAFSPMAMAQPSSESDSTAVITNQDFDAMQDVMVKMMNGQELSSSEWGRMGEFMEEHHGEGGLAVMGMMMGGNMMSDWDDNSFAGNRMMGSWSGGLGFVAWIVILNLLVWLLVGLLLSVLLIRRLNKK